MKNKNLFSKLTSGKSYFVFTAVSFCFIVVAALAVYRTSINRLSDILTPSADSPTEQVRHNEDNITDPRYIFTDVTESYTSEKEQETSVGWTRPEERESTESTTQEETKPVILNESYIFPVTGSIQRGFSPTVPVYDETMEDWRVHRGIDFECAEKTEIRSIGNGIVTKVVADNSFGYTVEIDHGDFTARYCGLEQGTTVKIDDTVEKGDTVGIIGSVPCENRQSCHLHFEAVKDGKVIDPMSMLKAE